MLLLITVQLKYFQLFFLQKWYFITIITAAFKLVSDIIKALVCQLGRQTQKFWLRCQIRPLCWVFLLLPVCKKRGAPGFHTRPTAVLMCNYKTMFTSDNRQMLHSYFSRHIYGLSASAALAFKFLQSGFNVVQSKLELNGHKSSLIVMFLHSNSYSHPWLLTVHPRQRFGLLHQAVGRVVQALHCLILPHHQAVHHPEHDWLQGETETPQGGTSKAVKNCPD